MGAVSDFLNKPLKLWKVAAVAALAGLTGWMVFRWEMEPVALEDSSRGLGIQTLVSQLRHELEQMEEDRLTHERGALFKVKDFDLELSFVIRKSQKDSAEIHPEVVTVGSEREFGRENTNKITLHMELVPPELVIIRPSEKPITGSDIVQLPLVKKGKK